MLCNVGLTISLHGLKKTVILPLCTFYDDIIVTLHCIHRDQCQVSYKVTIPKFKQKIILYWN